MKKTKKKKKRIFKEFFRAGVLTLTAIVSSFLVSCKSTSALPYNYNPPSFQVQEEPKSYDNSTVHIKEEALEDMLDAAYKVDVDAIYQNTLNPGAAPEDFGATGTGFVVKSKDDKQYFITCNHVVEAPPEQMQDWFGNIYELQKFEVYIVDSKDKRYLVDILSCNEQTDIAVLKSKEDTGAEKKIDFAEMELKPGDVVYAVGHPLGLGKLLSLGIITQVPEDQYFFESADLNPGNSGGPLYVLLKGEPKIAGVGQFYIRNSQGIFGAVHHKYAQEELEKALEKEEQAQAKPEAPQTQPQK